MAFPAHESTTPTTSPESSANHVADMPATVDAGDLLLAVIAIGPFGGSVTEPAGWTEMINDAGIVGLHVYARAADGSEGGTTVNFESNSGIPGVVHVLRISGWHGTVAGGVEAGSVASGSGTSPDSGSLAPSWGEDDTLWVACSAASPDNENFTGAPAGYGNLVSTPAGAGSNSATVGTATVGSAAASEDPAAYTLSGSENWKAVTVGVRPGVDGPAPAGNALTIGFGEI